MSIAAIESMLSSMRAAVQAAQGANTVALGRAAERLNGTGELIGFAAELQRSLAKVSAVHKHAQVQAQRFDLGDPDVALNDVMIDLQKANLGLMMTIQVRNKFVAAYKEIASMAV
jgi:flagellar hook-basal body complex protein FliE